MIRFWRKGPDPKAQKALVEAEERLRTATSDNEKSVASRLSLQEIRRRNHFGPSMFPSYGGPK